MDRKQKERPPNTHETEELDALNAEVQQRRNAAEQIRQRVEASIEAKAKKRRGREVPASAAWKH